MVRQLNKLSSRFVETTNDPGRYADGGGLYLQVSAGKNGGVTKSWLFRYMRGGATSREMGLGPVSINKRDGLVTLGTARDKAFAARTVLSAGLDPLAQRAQERATIRLEQAKAITFRQCATEFIQDNEAEWKNPKHREQWANTLATYAYPVIGDLAVADVDTGLVLKILKPIWKDKTETAKRVRGRIESVLSWASAHTYRQGDNPARWRGHLDQVLPKPSKVKRVKHHPALPYPEVPAFMAELRTRKGQSARALEFAVLTAGRTGAVIGATLDEIDWTAKVWTVPPERTGAKITGEEPKPKRVPLSDRAVEILKSLPREDGNPYVFIGAEPGERISDMAMLELLRDIRPGYVTHGFRSTFKDWCSETTNYPNEVSEAALWHVVADKVEAAYRRGDLFEKRRRLMTEWAKYCAKPARATSSNVVAIGREPAAP
jgi:integrase